MRLVKFQDIKAGQIFRTTVKILSDPEFLMYLKKEGDCVTWLNSSGKVWKADYASYIESFGYEGIMDFEEVVV